ncbi:Uncharacterised protein [Mycobacterium tuberculosis]|nr:Uncharacterised protein [Mycobacterium tuberculosis]
MGYRGCGPDGGAAGIRVVAGGSCCSWPEPSVPVCGGPSVGHAPADRLGRRIDVVWGGRPAEPRWRPTSKSSAGPSGFPIWTRWAS